MVCVLEGMLSSRRVCTFCIEIYRLRYFVNIL